MRRPPHPSDSVLRGRLPRIALASLSGWIVATGMTVGTARPAGAQANAPAGMPAPAAAAPVAPVAPVGERSVWKSGRYWVGAGTSILAHEAAHVLSAILLGGNVSVGFDKGRPTVYSGLDLATQRDRQFIFSSAGLTMQALLDEVILDRPRTGPVSTFERGMLAGGIGTTLFYFTIGRTGSVSDVDFMARTSSLSKDQLLLIYGGVNVLHAVRIAYDGRLVHFFTEPSMERGVRVGVRVE